MNKGRRRWSHGAFAFLLRSRDGRHMRHSGRGRGRGRHDQPAVHRAITVVGTIRSRRRVASDEAGGTCCACHSSIKAQTRSIKASLHGSLGRSRSIEAPLHFIVASLQGSLDGSRFIVTRLHASSQPHGTTAYAGSWDQGGESKRPAGRVPRIDHGVDRFFTAPRRRRGAPVTPVGRGDRGENGPRVSAVASAGGVGSCWLARWGVGRRHRASA